jgi:hypothetical protein
MNNMNKIQSVDIPTDVSAIDITDKEYTEDVVSINTHMTHLSLLTSHDRQKASDQQVPQSLQQNTQGNFAGQTGSTSAAAEEEEDSEPHNCCRNKSVLDDTSEFMDDEDDDGALLEIIHLEEFYEDEFWTKEQVTQSEQVLFAQKLKSLLNEASKTASSSASGHPLRKVLDLEYYSLTKLLERLQNDIEQSENIEIAATIMKEEEEEELEEQEQGKAKAKGDE